LDNDYANNNNSKKALVIAVSDYGDSSGLKSISFCKNDGNEIYNVLNKNGYDIPYNRKLIGYVDSQKLKNTIYDFFTDENNKPDDTLVFYYSGHGVPDKWGKTFLAPSNMDSEYPFREGFSFDDLTDSMLACNSQSIVTILDSCFSGSLKISKGLDSKSGEESATRIANNMIEEKSEKLKQGHGRCLLAASQGYEEAYDRQEKDHSVFTYYLLEGLKGHKSAVDEEGNVTYDTLGKFITREIGNLPPEKRPKQTPLRKGEVSGGEIVLANYPELKKTKESDYYTLFGKAEDYFRHGKYNEALECYISILKLQPTNEYALLRKGETLYELNFNEEARECFDEILKLNTANADAWYFKSIYFIKIEDYESAIKCLDESFIINPEDQKVKEAYFIVKSFLSSIKRGKKQDSNLVLEKILKTKSSKKIINESPLRNFNRTYSTQFNADKSIITESTNTKYTDVETPRDDIIKNNKSNNRQNPSLMWEKVILPRLIGSEKINLAVDIKNDLLYVISDICCQQYDLNGNIKAEWGSFGKKNREFNKFSLTTNSQFIYIANSASLFSAIQVFSKDGSYMKKWNISCRHHCHGVTADNSYIYVLVNDFIEIFDYEGNFIKKWKSSHIKNAIDIRVDSKSNIYIWDKIKNNMTNIKKFDGKGNFKSLLNIQGKICIDLEDYIYTINNNTIEKYDSEGHLITKLSIEQFNYKNYDIGIDRNNNLYIATSLNKEAKLLKYNIKK
jgi:tetratricopeptide (TPR) repeat protein